MAATYSALSQADDDATKEEGSPSAASASPTSASPCATASTTSPVPYLSLADQTYTPLSLSFDGDADSMRRMNSSAIDAGIDGGQLDSSSTDGTQKGRGAKPKRASTATMDAALVGSRQDTVETQLAPSPRPAGAPAATSASTSAAADRRRAKTYMQYRIDTSSSFSSPISTSTTNNPNLSPLATTFPTLSAIEPSSAPPVVAPAPLRLKRNSQAPTHSDTDQHTPDRLISQRQAIWTGPISPGQTNNNSTPTKKFSTTTSSPILSRSPSTTSPTAAALSRLQSPHEEHDAVAHDPSHPKPAIVRTASNASSVLRHPVPDLQARSGAYVGNIAVLEASAEKLSMTSSIEDAIRDLHGELKRTDSRRSSILAASLKNLSLDTTRADVPDPLNATGSALNEKRLPSLRQFSGTSIVDINSAARLGGYSPGGYIMSPTASLSNRVRSFSKASGSSAGMPDTTADSFPARHGPGNGSVHSIRSSKLSLAEIAESEPTGLTADAMDEADRAQKEGKNIHEEEETIRITQLARQDDNRGEKDSEGEDGSGLRTMKDNHVNYKLDALAVGEAGLGLERFAPEVQHDQVADQHNREPAHQRSTTPKSISASFNTLDTQNAFGDFDGTHCDPDMDFHDLDSTAPQEALAKHSPEAERRMSRPLSSMPRPTSYMDPETGNQMMYYPARVPAMLSLPQKLSKKPKAAVRNQRQSKVLSVMPKEARESRIWLPDPFENEPGFGSPLLPTESPYTSGTDGDRQLHHAPEPTTQMPGHDLSAQTLDSVQLPPPDIQLQRPQRLTGAGLEDKRKSRMSALVGGLPAQLRASAFFDLPSESPVIEVKDGSAMKTLDSILDASATAPVSAFTDHSFAGKLGTEVYGREKKRHTKSTSTLNLLQPEGRPNTSQGLLDVKDTKEVKKRASFFSLFHGRRNSTALDIEAKRNTVASAGKDGVHSEETKSLQSRADGEQPHAPGDGDSDEDAEVEGEEEVIDGPPTTLLAELQHRKYRAKMRTKPIHQANGMHSTLLELDAVAEMERKQRKDKRINLAWEDPAENPDAQSDDDEDVPLGMLYAAKAAGNNDIVAVQAELNRPPGLMERRAMEDNEPLSRRRERLHGRNPNALPMGPSTLTLNQAFNASGNLLQHSPSHPTPEEDDEVPGETLGERMRRLRAKDEVDNPLPRTRPVSRAFSAELLSVFGDDEAAAAKSKVGDNGKEDAAPAGTEGEETLGQRRKRLQAERVAREREMAAGALTANAGGRMTPTATVLLGGELNPGRPLNKRLSMADVLGAHPASAALGAMDPREAERRRVEEERARAQREKDEKMRMLRSQMPAQLHTPATNQTGPYMGGYFNDGTGGGAIGSGGLASGAVSPWATSSTPNLNVGMGIGQIAPVKVSNNRFAGLVNGGPGGLATPSPGNGNFNGYGGMPAQMHTNTNPNVNVNVNPHMSIGMNMSMNMGGANMIGYPLQGGQGQMDRVERWRQSIMP